MPFKGLRELVLKISPDEVQKKKVPFNFEGLQQGTYGVRCFQDVNGNGKLDKGLFGPSEPWGMSWQRESPLDGRSLNILLSRLDRILKIFKLHWSKAAHWKIDVRREKALFLKSIAELWPAAVRLHRNIDEISMLESITYKKIEKI